MQRVANGLVIAEHAIGVRALESMHSGQSKPFGYIQFKICFYLHQGMQEYYLLIFAVYPWHFFSIGKLVARSI